MTTFFLIRHASCEPLGRYLAGRKPGIPLDALGRSEAIRLADRLRKAEIAALYASPLERAQETAKFIAERTGLTAVTAPEFTEIEFGEWTGMSFDALHHDPRWGRYNRFRSGMRPPGGESMVEIQARALGGLERVIERHPKQTVAIVSHGDVIKAILMHYVGIATDFIHGFEISPASVSILKLEDWGPKLLCLNDTGGMLGD